MAQVIVRNLDDEVVRRLKERAAVKQHSLEQELREILADAALGDRSALMEEAARIREMGGRYEMPDVVGLIREDRDNR
jgi:plasmid stability protein